MASEKINREEIIQPENVVYQKPELLNDVPMHYCPGCSHGVVHKLVAEVIADMGMEEKAVGVSPVGCAVFAYRYIDIDWQEAAHGRAPALATAIKRLWPDRLVFTYQGDGDLACIGTAETIHALNRGENIVIIFINNAIYGMTGGQMAHDMSLRPRSGVARLSAQHHRAGRQAAWHLLRHPTERGHCGFGASGQESHPQGLRGFDEGHGIFARRDRFHMQQWLASQSCQGQRVDAQIYV